MKIQYIGKIDLSLSKLSNIIVTKLEQEEVTSYVSENWINDQLDIFKKLNFSELQIDNWKKYPPKVAEITSLKATELFKKYLQTLFKKLPYISDNSLTFTTANIQRQRPGHITVPHVDVYHTAQKSGLSIDDTVRFWVPLEDSKFGHCLFVDDEVLNKFSAGDVYTWDTEHMHTGVNAGFDDRYTLIVYFRKSNVI